MSIFLELPPSKNQLLVEVFVEYRKPLTNFVSQNEHDLANSWIVPSATNAEKINLWENIQDDIENTVRFKRYYFILDGDDTIKNIREKLANVEPDIPYKNWSFTTCTPATKQLNIYSDNSSLLELGNNHHVKIVATDLIIDAQTQFPIPSKVSLEKKVEQLLHDDSSRGKDDHNLYPYLMPQLPLIENSTSVNLQVFIAHFISPSIDKIDDEMFHPWTQSIKGLYSTSIQSNDMYISQLAIPYVSSVAQLRYAIAKIILPFLNMEEVYKWIKSIYTFNPKTSPGQVLRVIARTLPLYFNEVEITTKKRIVSWHDVDDPVDDTTESMEDEQNARNISIDDYSNDIGKFKNGNRFIVLRIFWRGLWSRFLSHERCCSVTTFDESNHIYKQWIKSKSLLANANGIDIHDLFARMKTPEILDKENLYYCSSCKDHVHGKKTIAIWSLPSVLVINLKRFEKRYHRKLKNLVNFPLDGLDLSQHQLLTFSGESDIDPPIYDCVSIVNHYGEVFGGHYKTYGRKAKASEILSQTISVSKGNTWQEFDDEQVRPIDESQVVSDAAYILVYERRKSSKK